ncbi:MAG: GDSL-type esterase/lipase family protein, partial [Bacteroidota bacterium]
RQINKILENALLDYTPDIVLIHLGTNDVGHILAPMSPSFTFDNTVADMTSIINHLRADNPNVIIYLAEIIPQHSTRTEVNEATETLNARFVYLANTMTTPESPIHMVDMHTGFDDADLDDGVHPTEAAAKKMAQRWSEAILE